MNYDATRILSAVATPNQQASSWLIRVRTKHHGYLGWSETMPHSYAGAGWLALPLPIMPGVWQADDAHEAHRKLADGLLNESLPDMALPHTLEICPVFSDGLIYPNVVLTRSAYELLLQAYRAPGGYADTSGLLLHARNRARADVSSQMRHVPVPGYPYQLGSLARFEANDELHITLLGKLHVQQGWLAVVEESKLMAA